MKVKDHNGGVMIKLNGNELAEAIDLYLVARRVTVRGPRTTTVNGEKCDRADIFVDSSGFVIDKKGNKRGQR